MIIKKYPAPPIETAASRYDRDWLHVPDLDTAGNDDDRHDRTLLQQTVERKSRRYVDDGISAVTGGAPIFGEDGVTEPTDPDIPGLVWIDDFNGPNLSPEWFINHPESITFSQGGLTITEGTTSAMLYYADAWKPGHDIFIDLLDQPGEFMRSGFSMSLVDEVGGKQIGINASNTVDGGETSFMVWPGPEESIYYEGIPPTFSLSGRHFLKFRDGKAQWWHNEALVAEIDHGELPESMNIGIGFQYYAGIIQRFGIVDSGSEDNGGGTPEPEEPEIPSEPEVPEGSYQENYTETY